MDVASESEQRPMAANERAVVVRVVVWQGKARGVEGRPGLFDSDQGGVGFSESSVLQKEALVL